LAVFQKTVSNSDDGFEAVEFRILDKNGILRYIRSIGKRSVGGGQPGILGVLTDVTERRTGEEKLRESEERYRDIFENSLEGIFQSTVEGRYTSVNPQFAHIFGYNSPEEMVANVTDIGQQIYANSEDRRMATQIVQKEGVLKNFVFEGKHTSGKKVWVSMNAKIVRDKTGKAVFFEGLVEDITERKKAEGALKEKEMVMESMVQSSAVATFVIDSGHTVLYWNKACEELTGAKAKDLIGTGDHWKAFYDHPRPCVADLIIDNTFDDMPRLYNVYAKSTLIPNGLHAEGWYLNLGGKDRYIVFDAAPIYNADGKRVAAIETLHDMTGQKKTEHDLRETSEYLEKLVNYANAPIIVWNPESRITRFNHAFEHLTDYTAEEVLGKELSMLFPEANRGGSLQKIAQTLSGERWDSAEIPILCRDGKTKTVLWNSANIYDKEGKALIATIAQGVDITDLKKAEEATGMQLFKFKVLYELALNMQEKTLEENLGYIVEKARELLNSDTAYICLCDEDQKEMCMHTFSGINTEAFKQMRPPYGKGLEELIRETRRGHIIEDYFNDPLIPHADKIIAEEGLVSGMAAPVQVRKTNLGILYVFNRTKTWYTEEDLATLTLLGNLAAIGIDSKRSQQALQDSQQRMSDIINFLPDATVVIDKDGVVIAWNKAIEELTGLRAENIIGKGDYEYALPFYGKRKPIFIDLIGKPLDEIASLGYTSLTKEGDTLFAEVPVKLNGKETETYLWLKASPIYDIKGQRIGSIESMRDITSRKKADEALNEELKRQEVISKISSIYLGLENFDEKTNNVLRILGELTGVSRVYIFEDFDEGRKTKNTYEWVNSCSSPQIGNMSDLSYSIIPSFKKILEEKGVISSSDSRVFPKDFHDILCPEEIKSVYVLPLMVHNKFHGFIGLDDCKTNRQWSHSDITLLQTVSQIISEAFERKIAEEQIRRRTEDLETSKQVIMNIMEDLKRSLEEQKKLEKIKTEFLSITSHELRTPITPMKAQLQMILSKYFGSLTEEQRTSLDMILRNADRLDRLISDILDISKLESGNMKFAVSKEDLNEIVRNSVDIMQYTAKDKKIKILLELENSIPPISMDKDRITQVMLNLLSNAVKFTEPGAQISVKTIDGKDKAIVEVADTGIGIPEDAQKKLFTPFFQVDSSMNRYHEGTGLGLAICKGIIMNHGGEITLRSTVGKGSVFSFTLPYKETVSGAVREVELFKLNK
jgi:PAS domain S-box-containing protein